MSDLVLITQLTTVNAPVAMAGLSPHTQRSYVRWIVRFLADINLMERHAFNLKELDIRLAASSLGPANLKAWLGQLKAGGLGKQSIGQAKAAVVWLAQLLADMEYADYMIAAGLSRVKVPRAEKGQRKGTWLTQDEARRILNAFWKFDAAKDACAARDSAIVMLLVICGLRRTEITTMAWGDLTREGHNAVIRIHGKGAKLRIVKLPDLAVRAIETWKLHYPNPQDDLPIFTRIWKGGRVTSDAITDRAIWLVAREAARCAGLPPVSPHDLRRTFARGAYEAGVPLELIRQTLGHSNIATTEHYVNAVLELNRSATDMWAEALEVRAEHEQQE